MGVPVVNVCNPTKNTVIPKKTEEEEKKYRIKKHTVQFSQNTQYRIIPTKHSVVN